MICDIVNSGLCAGCGACYSACKQNAITMKLEQELYYPSINSDLCNSCGLCIKVCPSFECKYHLPFEDYAKTYQGEPSVYVVYSNDETIRNNSASGGFITSLLLYLLESKKIDGAIVAYSQDRPETIKARLVTTKEDIIQAAGSKYYPVPICSVLKELDTNKKYAVVGKGCDFEAIKKYCRVFPKTKESIYLKVGLICHHTSYARAVDGLIRANGLDPLKIRKFVFRGEGWPGETQVYDRNNNPRTPIRESLKVLGDIKNTPLRCSLCTDGFACMADIAVGDAWFMNKQYIQQSGGFNQVLIYTDMAKDIIKNIPNSILTLKKSNIQELYESQPVLIGKNRTAFYRLFIFRFTGRKSQIDHLSKRHIFRTFCKTVMKIGFKLKKFLGSLKFRVKYG